MARQQRRYRDPWGMAIGALSMFLSSFSVTLLTLLLIIRVEPWYQPQYLIPLVGMLLGNTMSGIAIALDNLTRHAWEGRGRIEARLLLGADWNTAIAAIRRDALRSGLIPIVNAMATVGIVSLPGMRPVRSLPTTRPWKAPAPTARPAAMKGFVRAPDHTIPLRSLGAPRHGIRPFPRPGSSR